MEKALFVFGIVSILLISGCTTQTTSSGDSETAKQACIQLCQSVKSSQILTNGPCLSDNNPWDVSDWVCDVAHDPREAVDNLPENQCQEFRSGQASHFVEVDSECNFIKAV